MTLEGLANASRAKGSSIGLGGAYSVTTIKGDNRSAADLANNQSIIRGLAQAQRHGDWVTYQRLQQQLKHA